jgi:hypothetical protein
MTGISEIGVMKALIMALSCMLLIGCAAVAPFAPLLSTPLGSATAQVHTDTRVSLSEDNFLLVRTNIVGRSRGFSLLGIITIYPATLTKAMTQFYETAQMKTGRPQTSAHLIIEHSSQYYILFGIPEVDVRADIVEFASHSVSAGGDAQTKQPHKLPDTTQ